MRLPNLGRPTLEAVRYACSIANQVTVVADCEDSDRINHEWIRLMGGSPERCIPRC